MYCRLPLSFLAAWERYDILNKVEESINVCWIICPEHNRSKYDSLGILGTQFWTLLIREMYGVSPA
jgi:hypothetical protein